MSFFESVTNQVVKQGKSTLKPVLRPVAKKVQPMVDRAAGSPQKKGRAAGTPSSAKPAVAKATAAAYVEVGKKISSATSPKTDGLTTAPARKEIDRNLGTLRRLHSEARIASSLTAGAGLAESVIESVRELLALRQTERVTSMAYRLKDDEETSELGNYVLGMLLLSTSGAEAAWSVFSTTTNPRMRAAAAIEFYSAAVTASPSDAGAHLQDDIATGSIGNWDPKAILKVAQYAFTADLFDETALLLDEGLGRPASDMSQATLNELGRLASWLPGGDKRTVDTLSGKARAFGVVGYDAPGIRSRNIGDYIQTLASLGHLARQKNLSFTGDQDLVEFIDDARTHVKPERVVDGESGALELFEFQRDGNGYQDIPEDSWAVVFGWFMHETFEKRFDIPFHPHLRPILISVYVRYAEMLTEGTIEYLKKYAPVGCRDWQSVALLRAVGVPAFFSGCMTTTVDTFFPRPDVDERSGTIRVDWRGGGKGPSRAQTVNEIRDLSFADNLRLAKSWVGSYAYEYSKVLTKRLHAYLPARSVGAEVVFEPGNKSDWRFGGLIGIDDDAYEAIRTGILDKIGTILPMIARGESEETIYATWREITAEDLKVADENLASAELPVVDDEELGRSTALVRPASPSKQGVVDIFVDARPDEYALLEELLASIDTNAEQHYRILGWAPAFADVVKNGIPGTLTRGTVELLEPSGDGIPSADRLKALLPVLLGGTNRVIVLPAAARVSGDVTGLTATEIPEGAYLAAADDTRAGRQNGLSVLRAFANRQKDEYQRSLELVFASHKAQFRPFSADVMVLDLDALRSGSVVPRILGVMDTYGLGYEDALQIVIAGSRVPLEGEWNTRPQFDGTDEFALVNWRGQAKPGGKNYVAHAAVTNAS